MMQAKRIINANSILMMNTIGFSESFIPNSVYTQCVRWKRKPLWLPPAKSKLFRVPKRCVISADELEEIKRLNNNYRTYMTSLRAYMLQVYMESKKIQFDEATIQQSEEEDFQTCSAINDEWNAKIAKERTVRLAQEREKRNEFILQRLVEHEQKQTKLRTKIDKHIRKIKEEAPTFITAENVDAAIENCLGNIINHNRALDLKGKWHESHSDLSVSPAEETQKLTIAKQ